MKTIPTDFLVKACESHANGIMYRNWQFFDIGSEEPVYCTDFFIEEEMPSVNDFSFDNYKFWLDYCGDLEDTDENYSLFCKSVRGGYRASLLKEIDGIKIEYV